MDQEQPPERTGRKYRSKKQRPCDLCRTRKIQCKIQSDQSDCERCRKLNRHCTFVLGPLRRKYPSRENADTTAPSDANRTFGLDDPHSQPPQHHPQDPTFLGASMPGDNLANPANDTHLDIDMASFWSQSIDLQNPFGLSQPIPSQIMNWYTMTSPLGMAHPTLHRTKDEEICSANRSLGRLPTCNSPMQARDDSDREHSNSSLSPTDILLPPTSQVHAHQPAGSSPSASLSSSSRSISQLRPPDPIGPAAEGRGFDDGLSPYLLMAEKPTNGVLPPQQQSNQQGQRGQQHPQQDQQWQPPHQPEYSDWSPEFSLESRPGYSNQLIGMSSESDPYLLRHYYYNRYDTYPMFRLDFRKVVDDGKAKNPNSPPPIDQTNPSTGSTPIQFVLSDEAIWQDDVKAAEKLFGGKGTEESDMETLNKLVPDELGVRLLKLYGRTSFALSLSMVHHVSPSPC
jgi:hypothetical protein